LEEKLDSAEHTLQEEQSKSKALTVEAASLTEKHGLLEKEISAVKAAHVAALESAKKAKDELESRFKETEGRDKESAEQSVLLMEA